MQTTIPLPQLKKIHYELASRDLWHYCHLRAPKFYNDNASYLREVCEAIQGFENDDNELLIINMPPRFGKSRTAVNAVQWLIGRNPTYKIMTCSYNEKLSRKFSKQTRNAIQEQKRNGITSFSDVFPNVKVKYGSASVDMWGLDGNEEENYLATSPNATITGIGADFIVIDDIVKNSYEAYNQTILDKHWDWFTDTLYSRLEGKRKLLVFMTRWATKDLAGRLIELYQSQGRKLRVITKKACDNGVMLNDAILNKQQYELLTQTMGEDIVRANYDQEPLDVKGVLYTNFLTYEAAPQFTGIYAHCDTADEGDNYLCNIIWGKTKNNKAFILDVYYTQDSMDITEKETAKRLTEFRVSLFRPESNNGGRGFARAVEREYKALGNQITATKWYHQTLNKEARILSNATAVMQTIYFPQDWKRLFPKFYKDVTEYQRAGKNKFDDGVDVLTAIAESLITPNGIRFIS